MDLPWTFHVRTRGLRRLPVDIQLGRMWNCQRPAMGMVHEVWWEELKSFSRSKVKVVNNCESIYGNFLNVSWVIRRFLVKLATNIHHASGMNWNGCQRSEVKIVNTLFLKTLLAWHILNYLRELNETPVSVRLYVHVCECYMVKAYVSMVCCDNI